MAGRPVPERTAGRPGSMLSADLRRMFTQRLFYIMVGISAVLPVLILVMTGMAGGSDAAMFTNVWQAIGSAGSGGMSMDLTTMCNINMIYFLAAVFACLFTAADFRSGFCKNIFAVRAKKADYVRSKTAVCFLAGVCMLLAYFAGAMLGGKIAGLSFAMEGFNTLNLLLCMLAKLFLMAVFAAIYVLMGTIAKSRSWMSILLSFMVGMFLFMVIPMMTPLDAGFMNVVLCLAGGILFALGFSGVSSMVLQRTDIL